MHRKSEKSCKLPNLQLISFVRITDVTTLLSKTVTGIFLKGFEFLLNNSVKLYFFIDTVYADASASCNTLDFQLGPTAIGTAIPSRQWNIKVKILLTLTINFTQLPWFQKETESISSWVTNS
jgi:hypothetical protein